MDRLFVELRDGSASIGLTLRGEIPQAAAATVPLPDLLGPQELDDLRWYLEDYLSAPYAVYEEKGAEVESRLRAWGEIPFRGLFAAGPARDAYVTFRRSSRSDGQVLVRSESPRLLGLPWEL